MFLLHSKNETNHFVKSTFDFMMVLIFGGVTHDVPKVSILSSKLTYIIIDFSESIKLPAFHTGKQQIPGKHLIPGILHTERIYHLCNVVFLKL